MYIKTYSSVYIQFNIFLFCFGLFLQPKLEIAYLYFFPKGVWPIFSSTIVYKVSDYEECNLSINIFLHTALLLTTCYERLLRVLSLMLEFTSLRARSFNFILIFTRITNGIICMSLLLIILLPPFLILATNYVDIFKGYMQLFQRKG